MVLPFQPLLERYYSVFIVMAEVVLAVVVMVWVSCEVEKPPGNPPRAGNVLPGGLKSVSFRLPWEQPLRICKD